MHYAIPDKFSRISISFFSRNSIKASAGKRRLGERVAPGGFTPPGGRGSRPLPLLIGLRRELRYVDGYVLPVPRKSLREYRRLAVKAAAVWQEHGALAYTECVGEDLKPPFGVPFPRMMKARPGETIVFSYIVFRSRAHRDRVNAKVMKDPRLAGMNDPKNLPFDCKRMVWGGFSVLVGF